MSCILEFTLGLMQPLLSVNIKWGLKFLLLHLHRCTKRLSSTCNLGRNLYNLNCFVQLLFINSAFYSLFSYKVGFLTQYFWFSFRRKYKMNEIMSLTETFVLFSKFVHFYFYSMYFRCFKAIGRQSVSATSNITFFFLLKAV